jgi:hypothetical protein
MQSTNDIQYEVDVRQCNSTEALYDVNEIAIFFAVEMLENGRLRYHMDN